MSDVWDALSAVGTALAVVVALVLSITTERSKKAADLEKAKVVAARLVGPASVLEIEARSLSALCNFHDSGHFPDLSRLPEYWRGIRRIVPLMETETLTHLGPLPNHCASRFAHALSTLEILLADIDYLGKHHAWDQLTPGAQDSLVKKWSDLTATALSYLTVVVRELENSSGLAALKPSSEELYGAFDEHG